MQRKEKGKRGGERDRQMGRNSQRTEEEMHSEIKPQRGETSAEAEAGGGRWGVGAGWWSSSPDLGFTTDSPLPHSVLFTFPQPPGTSAPQLCQLPHAGQMAPIPRRTRQDPKPPCVPSCHPTHISKLFKPQKSHHLQDALASCLHPWSPLPTRSSPRAGTSPTCHPIPAPWPWGKFPGAP